MLNKLLSQLKTEADQLNTKIREKDVTMKTQAEKYQRQLADLQRMSGPDPSDQQSVSTALAGSIQK